MTSKVLTLQTRFESTTVDLSEITAYLHAYPDYLEISVKLGYDKHVCYCMAHCDGVDFWLRRYLTGHPATLRNVFWEIRAFLAYNDVEARDTIPEVLDDIRDQLLANEWYELIPLYTKARQRIRKTFQL